MPPSQNQTPSNPYDFITSPQQNNVKNLGPSKKMRILVIVLGAIVVIVLAVVITTFLGKAGKAQNQRMIELAQTQQEIVRVAAIGATKSKTLETKSLAINTQLSVESTKQDILSALKKRKIKIKDKQLTISKNTKTDALLQEATNNNRFDETFTELIQTKLANYQKQAKAVYGSATPGEQKALKTPLNNVSLLLPKSANQE